MSIVGILSSNLFSTGATHHMQNTQLAQANSSKFEQISQEFQQLGQDLQSGNLTAAQQDITNLQQATQQNGVQQVGCHHHRGHHADGSTSALSNSSLQQSFSRTLRTLSQDLQAGNISGAQSAFATLQNDLQQIGGFATSGPSNTGMATAATASGSLNVNA